MSAALWVRLNLVGNRFASRAAVREWFNTAAVLAMIVGLYTVVGTMDYNDAMRAQAEAEARYQTTRGDLANKTLLDCLNGKARWIDAEARTVVACDTPVVVHFE